MLERLERLEPVREQREWRFRFLRPVAAAGPPGRWRAAANWVIRTKLCSTAWSFSRAGDRDRVLGSTVPGNRRLVKAIVEKAPMPASSGVHPARDRYFAQHQLEDLDPTKSAAAAAPDRPGRREQELRISSAASVGWMQLSSRALSGGERARCALALLAWRRPNLLVWTNRPIIWTCRHRSATVALSSFEGALIVVSHDRHLLRATTDQLWLVPRGRRANCSGRPGTMGWVIDRARAQVRPDAGASESRRPADQRRQAAGERQRLARGGGRATASGCVNSGCSRSARNEGSGRRASEAFY